MNFKGGGVGGRSFFDVPVGDDADDFVSPHHGKRGDFFLFHYFHGGTHGLLLIYGHHIFAHPIHDQHVCPPVQFDQMPRSNDDGEDVNSGGKMPTEATPKPCRRIGN
ncbi:MAG: hypothetical protein HQK56_14985 [Deltaproteobacteria bacterium]|nr:hypothetical protein [Deltaproteobacteria bacterium]